ncbi:Methyl-accepting chemotaxis protein II [Hydrogenovibrio crunogenus]|uniref:Methyl-accepting chemotaxis protein II n=1 Tax=Hydrogenovibrio crunogenus TaxID=39765 RepID=A0A4P7P1M9_9GAMM|nr:methyl-accepting chemotaxis protein [Hydrogenovibrio crunogenus]QBZ83936.1 Methyl-accepting chemotaxis protein II [Hydrogenovibrio crunogenus]
MTNPNRPIIDESVTIPEHYRIISRTDLRGTILEANSEFIEISGYQADEILGQPHNILRHPDVPKAVFKDFWNTLQAGKSWTQIVKNRAKDGRHYWVKANAAPVFENNKISGYISVRTPATEEQIKLASQAYKDINAGKLIIKEGHIYKASEYRRLKMNPFRKFSILGKLATAGLFLVVIGFLASAFLANSTYVETVAENSKVRSQQVKKDINNYIQKMEKTSLNTALGLASNSDIITALENGSHQAARAALKKELDFIKKVSGQSVRAHIHDAQGHSFVRSWRDKQGDDLKSFRYTVNQVRDKKTTVMGIELGRAGAAIRSLSPIFSDDGSQFLGSVEVVSSIKALVKHFKEDSINYVSLFTPNALDIAIKAKDNPKFGNLTLASTKDFAPEAIEKLKQIDLNKLKSQGVLTTATDFFVMMPIIDTNQSLVGYHIFIEDLSQINTLNKLSLEAAISSVVKVTLSMLILIIIFLLIIRSSVTAPLRKIVEGMNEATESGDLSTRVDNSRYDEMGELAKAYNDQMQAAQISLGEAGRMLKDMSEGHLKTQTVIPMVGDFNVMKTNLNEASRMLQKTFGEVRGILKEIRSGNFSYESNHETQGDFKEAMQDAEAAMAILKGVFYEVNELMSQVAEGFFGRRITAEAEGEIKELKNNINASLDQLEAVIQETTQVMIAQGTGDLKKRIEMETNGTLAVLKAGINNSVTNIGSLLSQSNYSIKKLSDGTIKISQDISDLSARTQQQAASLEETAASMEQITSTIQQTANNAREANEAANESLVEAQDANQVVQKTITSINEINEASTKISEITTLIDSIAFQTNLLALNAAVEAARAGDHGRGFAVVAGEVRSLAGKSAEAAKDIRQLIDNTVEKVHEGAKLADESGKALELINDSIAKIGNYVSEISQTTAEQAKGVEQVNIAISSIDQVTQQNSALVDETADRTTDMSKLAEDVNNVISTFKIDLNQIGFSTAMQTGEFTFANARRAHSQWKGLVTAYVEGVHVEFDKEAATDHHKCALGQWFYGSEGQQYANQPEMQTLEKWHAELHATIKRILTAHQVGDIDNIKNEFRNLDKASEEVIHSLTQVEQALAKDRSPKAHQQQPRAIKSTSAPKLAQEKPKSVPPKKENTTARHSAETTKADQIKAKPDTEKGMQKPAPSQPKNTSTDEWSEF